MEDNRARADEGAVLHGAALEVGEVPDDASGAHDRREVGPGVDDGAVLDRRALADHDAAEVAAQHAPAATPSPRTRWSRRR